jgi:hypothetical protein
MAEHDRLLMCAENVREGMRLGPISYVVSPEQIERFGAVTAFGKLAESGVAIDSDIAPPTMRLQDYALLIAAHFRGGSGGVHAKHRSEFHGPMRAGQKIVTTGHIVKVWRNRGKFYFELEYESHDADSGALLVRQTITSVLLTEGKMQ